MLCRPLMRSPDCGYSSTASSRYMSCSTSKSFASEAARCRLSASRISFSAILLLLRACNDARGVTAAFNLNLLRRISRELGGTVPGDGFNHFAQWSASEAHIEMLLEADRD